MAFILHRIAGVLQEYACTTRNDVTVCNTTFPIVWAVGKHCNLQLIDFVGCYKTFIESVNENMCAAEQCHGSGPGKKLIKTLPLSSSCPDSSSWEQKPRCPQSPDIL